MAGALLGIPVGVFGLVALPSEIIKILMGTAITTFALLFAIGYRREIKNETPALILLGMVSGILGGSTSLGGPPIILFLINQECEKITFRANLSLFYTLQSSIIFLGYIKGDLISAEILRYSFILCVPLVLGIYLGMKLVHKVEENLFRRIALTILLISGITAIYTGVRALL